VPATVDRAAAHGADVAWHAMPVAEVEAALATRPGGLEPEDAAARLAAEGANLLPSAPPERPTAVLARQLVSPLIVALLAAGALALALGDVVDGVVVLAVVAANALVGFVQEWQADRSIAALDGLVPERAAVVRGGRRLRVAAGHVVRGDLLELEAGARVAADARVVTAHDLTADEASLTGESLPVRKSPEPVDPAATVADRTSVVHGGTLVAAGTGTAVVVATGAGTQLGHVGDLLASTRSVATPLTRTLAVFAWRLTIAIGAVSLAMLLLALARGVELLDAVLAAMAFAVAAVPEGLPAIVTIALAVGVRRMARRDVVVRHLPAVEALGATTIICTDKTGTLTMNRMAVTATWTPPDGDEDALLRAAVLCNDAVDATEGDPTETALVAAAAAAGLDPARIRAHAPRRDVLPFDAERRLMVTVHREQEGIAVAYVKGAPEVLLPRCVASGGEADAVRAMADDGMRVLAVARCPGARDAEAALGGRWELLGLCGLADPARPSAPETIRRCHEAGIRVTMVTGDHPRTAVAIGRGLGLEEQDVLARVAPAEKLRIVEGLQRDGEVVAMTGDGVNDAPALRRADIGVAMGREGTATARAAADVVLLDDDVASIAAAVHEGRRVRDNVEKAVVFVLPTNLGEAVVLLVALLVLRVDHGTPLLPVAPTQILWINLVATVTLALPLALERGERGLMHRRPRAPRAPLLDRALLVRVVLVAAAMAAAAFAVFVVERRARLAAGATPATALAAGQTAAATAIVLFQAVYLLACRSLRRSVFRTSPRGNPSAWIGIGIVLVLQAAFVHLGPLADVFGTAPLGQRGWLVALAGGLAALPATEGPKYLMRRRSAGRRRP
jgi:Ca2+-transporting ATPase